MLPFTLQVKHLIPFPRMEMHQNILNKMNWNNIKFFQLHVLSSPFSFFLFLVRNCQGSDCFGCLYFDMGLLMALWRSFSSSTVKRTLSFLSRIGRGSGIPVGIIWAERVVLGVGICALTLPVGRAICAESCLCLTKRLFVWRVLPLWSRTIYSLSFFPFEMISPTIVLRFVLRSWMNTFVPGGSNGCGVPLPWLQE